MENDNLKLGLNNTPFEIAYSYDTEEILEEVGNNYILSIGKIIGTQNELYQEEKRVNHIELSYPNQYRYTITVKIPKEYRVKNIQTLNYSTSFKTSSGEIGALFSSNYILTDNIITIKITEQYNKANLNISYYQKYKDVINAAYDFTKKVILFEKK